MFIKDNNVKKQKYIYYYNNKRIKNDLKGLSPMNVESSHSYWLN
ncbi:MAG: IS3 family transposase [Peptostreptococcaceae bacterium]|nr:IS3 family transposase [Peptostreptococcaceae bacterium]